MLKGKNVILGISGGIAAYKVPFIIRHLISKGAKVKVVCTENALEFVTKLCLETLSNNSVYYKLFDSVNERKTEHISVSDWADIMIVAPATANVIGKFAAGIADDALSTTYLAFDKQIFIAPSMNTNMWHSAAVMENIEKLKRRGHIIIGPDSGELACGTSGEGRMSSPEDIVEIMSSVSEKSKSLQGKQILITAGPTVEKIDPVRFISNFSSGKMGFAIAEECRNRGANVFLVSGPVSIPDIKDVKQIKIQTACEMHKECEKLFVKADIAIMAAAVADYRPEIIEKTKIKKEKAGNINLSLVKNPDILGDLGKKKKQNQLLVGFALETNNEIENAKEKLIRKNADFIVMNSMKDKGCCFNSDENKISIVSKNEIKQMGQTSKTNVAKAIVDEIENKLK